MADSRDVSESICISFVCRNTDWCLNGLPYSFLPIHQARTMKDVMEREAPPNSDYLSQLRLSESKWPSVDFEVMFSEFSGF